MPIAHHHNAFAAAEATTTMVGGGDEVAMSGRQCHRRRRRVYLPKRPGSSGAARHLAVLLLCVAINRSLPRHSACAFVLVLPSTIRTSASAQASSVVVASSTKRSSNDDGTGGGGGGGGGDSNKNKRSTLTLQELSQIVASNPAKYLEGTTSGTAASQGKSKKKGKRTRQRVLNPQQTYLYRSQRNQLEQQPSGKKSVKDATREDDGGEGGVAASEGTSTTPTNPVAVARAMGLVASTQHCHPDLHHEQPALVGHVRIGDESVEAPGACFAYVIHKPAGWSVLGGGGGGESRAAQSAVPQIESVMSRPSATLSSTRRNRVNRSSHKKRVKIVEADGSTDVLEYSELDVMALLTPEELEEYLADAKGRDGLAEVVAKDVSARDDDEADEEDDGGYVDDEASPFVEITALEEEDEEGDDDEVDEDNISMDPVRAANLRRIEARRSTSEASQDDQPTLLVPASRPSIVSWLKDSVGEQAPIRGGTYWAAVAGATRVDDSGLVVVAPRHKLEDVRVNAVEYLAVMGTGEHLAKTRSKDSDKTSEVEIEVVSRLRKGRGDDVAHVVKVRSTNPTTSCSSIIAATQEEFQQGVRGDPEANPFDRRASRRLIHCRQMTVSSSVAGPSSFESESIPLDIAVVLERGQPTKTPFTAGSFLGRSSLRNSTATNAYREINGAADGCPGWTVDRYDKWLFVQHDPQKGELGPLPSIHDGNTAGVYLLEQSSPDRSTDGSIRPKLLEGKAAPERFPIRENGITYLVSLQDMSTGIFLDQRPQRAWLARNCQPGTRVLNCFAHSGAYSVAAATAGASTVSIDLSRKWLERLPDHLAANGIPFDERHDAIYGDCFDWLGRLAKRSEKYDIVILDPPSSSVGGRKKRRWSIKNDMDELVSLAAGLVKKGGYLWTTTNSASIHPVKFARLCKKGLDDAGLFDAKLERVQPMPGDFPTIGPQAVKNLVWRIP